MSGSLPPESDALPLLLRHYGVHPLSYSASRSAHHKLNSAQGLLDLAGRSAPASPFAGKRILPPLPLIEVQIPPQRTDFVRSPPLSPHSLPMQL